MKPVLVITLIFLVFIAIGCFGRSLTTREELGAGNGAVGAAAVGGIIGAAVGTSRSGYRCWRCARARPGLLIGDQLQGQEQSNSNQSELDRQRGEFERLKKRAKY